MMPSTISQTFADRASALKTRITMAAGRGILAPGQQQLLDVQLDAAQKANASRQSDAPAMLDVIDRQLAQVDHGLSRAENGQAIVVHIGDDVVVAMHDPYIYDLRVSDIAALSPHVGVMYVRGIQGVYTAKTPGTVTIALVPRPNASPAPPAKLQSPVTFTIVILPKGISGTRTDPPAR